MAGAGDFDLVRPRRKQQGKDSTTKGGEKEKVRASPPVEVEPAHAMEVTFPGAYGAHRGKEVDARLHR